MLTGRCCFTNDSLVSHAHRVMRVNQTTIEQVCVMSKVTYPCGKRGLYNLHVWQEKLSLYYKTMPEAFARRGLFWWRAQLVSFLFTPRPHMRGGPAPRFHLSTHIRHDNIAEAVREGV